MSINYTAPPTVGRFMLSQAFMRILAGPVGSGKTTGCLLEILKRAIEQKPSIIDGMRRTRWAIVRTTLSQLKMSVLLDILSWYRQIATYRVTDQLITLAFNDVVCEIFLIPLEEEEDQKRLLSMQLTGAWVNEAIEMSVDLVGAIAGRCGRFPSMADGGPTWHGIIADTNAPIEGSDWWKVFEEDRPADWDVFWQPSGLSDQAENLENLPKGYYQKLAENPNRDWVRRYVECQYGEDPSGVAVFRESFKRSFHTVDHLEPVVGKIILIGQDFGRAPCSLICQPDHKGRLLVLEEVLAEDIGLETHVARSLKPALFSERYAGRSFAAVGDPSGRAKGNFLEEDSFDVMRRLGIPCFPAPSNNIQRRAWPGGGSPSLATGLGTCRPALVIDEARCPMLVRALNGAYRYQRNQAGVTKPLKETKHPRSDNCDDLQYVCMTYNSGLSDYVARKIKPKVRKRDQDAPSSLGWT